MTAIATRLTRPLWMLGASFLVLTSGALSARQLSDETQERSRIAAANLEDAIVVDCQLPGKLQKLGGIRTYLTPGTLTRLSAVDCRARGGEYTLGDLSSGTLSLQRWLPLAEQGKAEAQYYVARIYANGMSGVTVDYAHAANWYRRAAQQEHSAAMQELGYLYERGIGVQQDSMMALNLQRKAAGLGKELDYSWKIAAAQEEAAQQVAALTEELHASNAELLSLRAQVQDTTNAAFQARAELARSESVLLDLREQLQAVAVKAAASTNQDGEKVRELQNTLLARETALHQAQARAAQLSSALRDQQTRLSALNAASQASSAALNELLANEQLKNRSLEARIAQSEQRLIASQQELANLRSQYRADVEKLVAEREEVRRAAAGGTDGAEALVYARERELARQLLRVTALEKELNEAKQATTAAASAASRNSRSAEQAEKLRADLAQLQARYTEQQQQFKLGQQELAALRAQSERDRAALVGEMSEQLARRDADLASKQGRIAAMEAETDVLRGEINRLNQQRDSKAASVANEATRAREALRMAQSTLAEQRERLDKLQTEKATETAALARARDELQRELAANRQTSELQLAFLKRDLETRQKDLAAKDNEITRLEKRLSEQSQIFTETIAQARPTGSAMLASNGAGGPGTRMRSATSEPRALPTFPDVQNLGQSDYHALIIANNNYHHLPSLDTPANDAREIGRLLEERYGFRVTVLFDQTREQIMTALHEQTLSLAPQDSLLVYYAGHGDADSTKGRAYWLGVDANTATRAGWLEADHVRAKIKEMRAKHVLLVADSCFSGAITHPKTTTIGRSLNETRLRVQWNRRARMVLTSGQVTPVADSASDPNHSLFARHFIQILRQNVNVMSGEMLSHELAARMLAEPIKVGDDGQRQTPTYSALQDANHDVGDFFFVPVAAPVSVAGLGL